MKQLIIVVGLLLLATTIFAQRSLYDIQFDDVGSAAEMIAKLKAQGFVETERIENKFILNGPSDSDLPKLELQFDLSLTHIVYWKVVYNLVSKPDLAETILAKLTALHGRRSVEDDYDYDYIWYFPDYKALYVTHTEGVSLILDYTFGDWDEDDFYYYYENY